MVKALFLTAAALAIAASAPAQGGPSLRPRCLHGGNETPEQAARRDKAIKVAQAINAAEVVTVGPSRPKYRRPEDLPHVPPLPDGFEMQFDTNGSTYSFSIKDTLDACHFAIFSDQEKYVYATTPITGARIVPLTSR
jgi:hypothetical protein